MQYRSSKGWVGEGGHKDARRGKQALSHLPGPVENWDEHLSAVCAPLLWAASSQLLQQAGHAPCTRSLPDPRELAACWPFLPFPDVIQNPPIFAVVGFLSPFQTCTYAYNPGHPAPDIFARGILAFPLTKSLHYGNGKILEF